jgi:antitoxin component YwqK of YwqJK toxin-antitoxin module
MKTLLRNTFILAFLAINIKANDEARYIKYANVDSLYVNYAKKSINSSSLVERQGLKYQVNTNSPFSGRFITYEDNNIFCVLEAGSYKKGLLHGPFEEYVGCGMGYSIQTAYKNGLEHGDYKMYEEGYLVMKGNMRDGLMQGEWVGYEYGRLSWTENLKNDETVSFTEYSYYENGQISMKEVFNDNDELHGISEAYHQNGQLKSKIEYQNDKVVRIIEEYDFNGNLLN